MGPETVAPAAPNPSFFFEVIAFFNDGGIFMYVILAIWIFGLVIVAERFKAFYSWDVDGPSLMDMVKRNVLMNEVQKAIQACSNSKSLLAYVLKSGLKRANQNKEQIQDAVESSILEVSPKLEKRMGQLALCSNISTLFGLLGTIQGLIQSFGAVANADPASKAKLLAIGISVAMNTTALGLLSAISLLVAHQTLVSKGEKIQAEVDEFSSKLVDLLGTKKHLPVAPANPATNEETDSAA
ncbi:MAG: hypothetical protein A2X86_02385 [Bdellovibrionales bacterium GWA2_49_15]|nr:MAG: hypothetical protein A2X86_02385 [Bdellovibrionales bacterium GWA2_49_15]